MEDQDVTVDRTPDLDAALVVAQLAAVPATKDGYNEHHRYDYTSAETVIHLCSDWLNGAGLALAPLTSRLERLDGEWILHRVFVLSHCSGQQRTLVQDWPVVPGKGRPIDKAVAVADTASLSYLLRTLLLMPRVEEGLELDSPRGEEAPGRSQREEPRRQATAPKSKGEPGAPRQTEPSEPSRQDTELSPYQQLWDMVYERCMALESNVEPLTDEQMDQVAETLFKRTWEELTDDEIDEHLGKLPRLSKERLNQLVGGFLIPF